MVVAEEVPGRVQVRVHLAGIQHLAALALPRLLLGVAYTEKLCDVSV